MIYELLKDRIMNGGSGSEAIIKSLSISANGVYTASSGVDGYSPITVNVPQKEPNIQNLAISANGTYTAPADVDGYNPITVNVPQKEPNIQNLSITTNGTYTAPSGTDGYSPVVVDVQPDLENITITANGTYTHTGKDGYDQVVVNVPQGGLDASNITLACNPSGLFEDNKWDELLPHFRNISIETASEKSAFTWDFSKLFADSKTLTDLSNITFNMNKNMIYFRGWEQMFYNCEQLMQLPNFDWTNTTIINPNDDLSVKQMFYQCNNLRTIPDTLFSDMLTGNNSFSWSIVGNKMFQLCFSLRQLPDLSAFHLLTISLSNSIYKEMFTHCQSLDEIVDLPVMWMNSPSSSAFNETTFTACCRIKELTFKSTTERTIPWKSQVIDLTASVGQALDNNTILGYNSGITADKEVTDDASYQALKNDPDWFTCNVAYSRYNHDSAVNTINSLPNCSAGTNTIKFKGEAGSLTDGGAINTLTTEEIAVATAKNWTITLV